MPGFYFTYNKKSAILLTNKYPFLIKMIFISDTKKTKNDGGWGGIVLVTKTAPIPRKIIVTGQKLAGVLQGKRITAILLFFFFYNF